MSNETKKKSSSQTSQSKSEKEKFFKTLNDFIVTSGVVAAGIKAVTNGITNQVEKTKRETQKKALTAGFTTIGLVFAFIGSIGLVTHYFGLSVYTNLIIGGIFLMGALAVKTLR